MPVFEFIGDCHKPVNVQICTRQVYAATFQR